MSELEYIQRLFGSPDDGVLYLAGRVMKAVKIKPGDKLKLTVDNNVLRIQKADNDPQPGGQP